ncbi:DUF2182 domain-containing protein [Burkholderiaceae bacterium UC74_6]
MLLIALGAIVALAWWFLWLGAGMGMPASEMTAALLFPHRYPGPPGDMNATWQIVLAMWWVMMIAMMTPAALPLVALYRRVLVHHRTPGWQVDGSSALLFAGYAGTWLAFSALATAVQFALQPAGFLSDMTLWSRSRWLSALVLAAAGGYQFSPWKQLCLSRCRNPASYLTRFAQHGALGALRLGVRHGAYCVGCCGLLMALLFVGGVMNLIWIAALSALVLCEKLLPGEQLTARVTGTLLLVWAAATLVV